MFKDQIETVIKEINNKLFVLSISQSSGITLRLGLYHCCISDVSVLGAMDVTDILGISRPSGSDESFKALLEDGNNKQKLNKKNQTKPKGMSRELFALMGPDGLTPSIQTNQSNLFKDKRQHLMHGKWVWSKFRNSARNDDLQCSHWIKTELQGYDYTYAKFNVKIEPISYKDDEYEALLQNPNWTRSETDHLMFLCYEYDLRWPVIADRYEASSPRTVEELMHRYYFIVSKLKSNRAVHSDFNNRNSASESFNIDYERARRKQQDLLFRKFVLLFISLSHSLELLQKKLKKQRYVKN